MQQDNATLQQNVHIKAQADAEKTIYHFARITGLVLFLFSDNTTIIGHIVFDFSGSVNI